MIKWLQVHYQAASANSRARSVERKFRKLRNITIERMASFDCWLCSIRKSTENARELADHCSSEIDRLESLHRDDSIRIDELAKKLDLTVCQLQRLCAAVELHNYCGKILNERIDTLESEVKSLREQARPAVNAGPVLWPPSLN
jgi:AraC-like DNA-binding protein